VFHIHHHAALLTGWSVVILLLAYCRHIKTAAIQIRLFRRVLIVQVTMSDRSAAERACKDPNPVIDGRKTNVNLAYLGAKPRVLPGRTLPGYNATALRVNRIYTVSTKKQPPLSMLKNFKISKLCALLI